MPSIQTQPVPLSVALDCCEHPIANVVEGDMAAAVAAKPEDFTVFKYVIKWPPYVLHAALAEV